MNRKLIYALLFLLVLLITFFLKNRNRYFAEDKFDRNTTHLIFTKHAKCRMDCRDISESEISSILKNGAINASKSEPNGKPDPKFALEGYSKDGQHLRVIFAPTARGMVVITCIDLEKEWSCDCR